MQFIFSIPILLIILNLYLAWSFGKAKMWTIFRIKKIELRDLILVVLSQFLTVGFGLALMFNAPKDAEYPEFINEVIYDFTSGDIGNILSKSIVLFILAFIEELTFRSLIIERAKEEKIAFTMVILVSILFASIHEAFYPQLFAGFIYSWIFLKYGSILLTTILHFIFNFVSFGALALINLYQNFLPENPNSYYVSIFFVLIGIVPMLVIIGEIYNLYGRQDRLVHFINRYNLFSFFKKQTKK